MTHGDVSEDGGMDAAEFAKLMGAMPDPPDNPLYQTGGGFMDNPGGFAWVSNAESFSAEYIMVKCDSCGKEKEKESSLSLSKSRTRARSRTSRFRPVKGFRYCSRCDEHICDECRTDGHKHFDRTGCESHDMISLVQARKWKKEIAERKAKKNAETFEAVITKAPTADGRVDEKKQGHWYIECNFCQEKKPMAQMRRMPFDPETQSRVRYSGYQSTYACCDDCYRERFKGNPMGKSVQYAETFEAEDCTECADGRMYVTWVEFVCNNCSHTEGPFNQVSQVSYDCSKCDGGTLEATWIEYVCNNCPHTMYGAETFEAPYGGAGAIMDIGKDTPLANFTDEELTKSSAIHGDFDTASIDYSGHQNIEVRAESFSAESPCSFRDCDEGTLMHMMGYGGSACEVGPVQEMLNEGGYHLPTMRYVVDFFDQSWGGVDLQVYTLLDMKNPFEADTDAYTYAYTEGHSDSRKREGFHPSMDKGDSKDFSKILRQKAEMEPLTSDIVDVSNRIGETVGRVRVQDDEDDMEDVFVEVENEDGDVIMEGKLEDEWTPKIEDMDYYYGESFESSAGAGGIVGGIIPVEGGGVHWAMQPDNNPDVQWIVDPNDPEGHTIAVPLDYTPPPTGGESGSGGSGENGSQPPPQPQPEEENGGSSQEESNGGDQEGQQEEEQQGEQPPPQQDSGSVDALAAEDTTSFLTILLGTTATLIGLGLLSKKLTKKAEFHNETDEPTEDPDLIMSPNTGDLSPANYEELVVESTGYAVDIIPICLDGSFMGSRFNALPTDRFIDYNEPGIGAHTDIALTRNENFREPEQSMVQASETEVKETQAPGQSPYFQMGHEPVDMNYRVLKETTTVSLDPAVRAFIPQSMSGYTGQKYAPPSVYEKMFGLGVSGITPAFVSGESDMGANRFGSRDAQPDRLSNIGGPLSDSVNAGYTDGNTTISLAQWSIENQVQPVSDTEAIVIDRSSGARKMIRRV